MGFIKIPKPLILTNSIAILVHTRKPNLAKTPCTKFSAPDVTEYKFSGLFPNRFLKYSNDVYENNGRQELQYTLAMLNAMPSVYVSYHSLEFKSLLDITRYMKIFLNIYEQSITFASSRWVFSGGVHGY